MTFYVIRRFIEAIPTALLVAIIAFLIIHLAPGDPASFFVGPEATEAEVDRVRERMGLDRPLPVQFTEWLGGVFRGDLGNSIFVGGEPVFDLFVYRMTNSLWLIIIAMIISLAIGLTVGITTAVLQNTWIDKILTIFVFFGVTMPSFWLGLILIYFFAVNLGLLPSGGFVSPLEDFRAAIPYLILPGMALGYRRAALIARMTRTAMLETLRQDYIRTARAKGLEEKNIIIRHALKNAMAPILTVIGITMVSLLGGTIVTEVVFNYPGYGRLIVDSVLRRDFPVLQGSLLMIGMIVVFINLLVDLSYALVDPRIKYN